MKATLSGVYLASSFDVHLQAMRKWIDLFFAVDDPPERIGVIGFAIMAIFGLFAAYVWFHHASH